MPEQPEGRLTQLINAIETATGPLVFDVPPNLTAIQAGRDHLQARRGEHRPPWIDAESDGLSLIGADLSHAQLSHAVLDGANLRGALLHKATGHAVSFSHAILEAAKLTGADFGGTHFNSIKGGETDFSGAMLEDARFEHAGLRFANLSDTSLDAAIFAHADLWGACLTGTDADEASFRRARLDEANLSKGNFTGADFGDASLKKANLSNAKLLAVNLAGARLDGANLARADLSRSSLPRVNLLSCDLTHIRLAGAWLELTRLQARQLGGAIGEEIAGEYEEARQAYIGLEQNFRSLGDSDDASWAFRKRRMMGKKNEAALARGAFRTLCIRACVEHSTRWLADVFVEWLCDYGESLGRVVRAFLLTILTFAAVYGFTGALTRIGTNGRLVVTRDPLDLLAYSFLNMLSTNMPDIGLKPLNELVVIVSSMQGAIGIVLIGLFGYVLGNRMRQ